MEKLLYLIATPIGNLEDITLRAVRILKEVDALMVEDSRVTGKLLHHLGIQKKMIRLAAFDEGPALEKKLDRVFSSHSVLGCVSDAGTPGFMDPGAGAVRYCRVRGIPVQPIPGPNAYTALLSASGFSVNGSLFCGFLPNKKGRRKNQLIDLLKREKKLLGFYESTHRIQNLLEILSEFDQNLEILVGRELTKKFETLYHGRPAKVARALEASSFRGEFTVLVDNRDP